MSRISARQKILDVAQQLMAGKGYSATTVDEIIGLAGVAKGSFYHAFKSKEDLAIAALDDFEAKGMAILAQGDYRQEADPVKRALAFLDFLDEQCQLLWAHGCLLGTVSLEVAESVPGVHKHIDRLFDRFERALQDILEPALKAKGVNAVSARDLSVHLLAVIEGSIITAKSHARPEYLNNGLRQFRSYVQYLLGEVRT